MCKLKTRIITGIWVLINWEENERISLDRGIKTGFINKAYCLKEGISRVPSKKLLEMTYTPEKYPPWEQEAPIIKSNLVPMGISGHILVNLFWESPDCFKEFVFFPSWIYMQLNLCFHLQEKKKITEVAEFAEQQQFFEDDGRWQIFSIFED